VKPIELPNECPQCHYLKRPRCAKCPNCGHEVVHHAKPIVVQSGTLKELKPEDIENKAMPAAKKFPNKHQTYGELMWYQRKHSKSEKWALANYKQLYGVWPREASMGRWHEYFHAPSMDLASWIQSRRIAYAKSKKGNRWTDDNIQNDRANGHSNDHANGHDHGGLSDREQAAVDRTAERVTGTLMTEDDWREFDR